jgi:hypothetical protein
MAIVRLALGNPSANTDTLLHTATRQSLISVLATNTHNAAATVKIWVEPQGASSEEDYAYLTYDAPLPINNSLETFRVPLQKNDKVYVRASTDNISFSINAIHESSGNQNIVTVANTAPNAPDIGDVWVSSATSVVSFWDGSDWVSAVGGSAGFPQPEEPGFPTTGTLWVDTDAEDPNYPAYPTVIYSPTDPSASLTFADVGTIWVDENAAEMVETVVPAVLYSDTEPDHLGQGQAGYLWVDSDADIIEYNMNEYARKDELINPFMLAGM